MSRRLLILLLTLFALSCTGCGETDTGAGLPPEGTLLVTLLAATPAGPSDALVSIDGAAPRAISSASPLRLEGLPLGDYTLELSGLLAECSVEGENPRTVTLSAGDTAEVVFSVRCLFPLSGQMVFWSDRDGNDEIYLMNADGSDPRRLTNRPASLDQFPAVSPDGLRIAFASSTGSNLDVWVMNVDGSGLINLTSSPGSDFLPTWSPDGTRIAFASRRNGQNDVFVMNVDGTGIRNLTSLPGSFSPSWSPDGSRIAFVRKDAASSIDTVYSIGIDGSGLLLLAEFPPGKNLNSTAWSPDGSRIAFRNHNDKVLWLVNPDGTNLVSVPNAVTARTGLAWEPSGTRIAFISDATGDDDIFTVNLDGTGLLNISNNSAGADHIGQQGYAR